MLVRLRPVGSRRISRAENIGKTRHSWTHFYGYYAVGLTGRLVALEMYRHTTNEDVKVRYRQLPWRCTASIVISISTFQNISMMHCEVAANYHSFGQESKACIYKTYKPRLVRSTLNYIHRSKRGGRPRCQLSRASEDDVKAYPARLW